MTADPPGWQVELCWPSDGKRPDVHPEGCATAIEASERSGDQHHERQRWSCGDALVISAERSDAPVIVRVGDDLHVLDAAHARLDLRGDGPVFVRWVGLGAEHLAGGLDHVLLVLGLLALIGLRTRLLAALTAFTLGHSLSLALAATGILTLPSAPVEVAIALTLVGLGLELTRPERSIIVRRPWVVGVAIGLVHGLGFAGALAALRLPQGAIAEALVGFNLGLELAQLTLVLGAGALAALLRPRWRPHAATAVGWLVGIAGATWTIDRLIGALA